MKTILLLHREELTKLFILISKTIATNMNVIHVAYSEKEMNILKKSGIKASFIYRDLCNNALLQQKSINLDLLKEIDSLFLKNTENRFNLNSSIQSDRGFSSLTYEETLLMAQVNYIAWKQIFYNNKIHFILHEPCSLFFNHLAAVMCKEQGGWFLWNLATVGEDARMYYLNIAHDDFSCPEIDRGLKHYNSNESIVDIKRCKIFVDKFRCNYDVFMQHLQPSHNIFNLYAKSIKKKCNNFISRNRYHKLLDNIDYWLVKQNQFAEKLNNLKNYKKYNINFENLVEGEKYYYYSFHLEPEAVVLYLGDGIYANQVKLIENIAASLPVGYYLYVKDHPHEFAYRNAYDYSRLSKIPNIRLIKSAIPGKLLIKNSIGVFTINGTAGFEGLMLGKQVYCFGKSYYTSYKNVNYIENIRDLKKIMCINAEKSYEDDIAFFSFVNAYLDSLHLGMVDYFNGRSLSYKIDLEENAQQIAIDLLKFSKKF